MKTAMEEWAGLSIDHTVRFQGEFGLGFDTSRGCAVALLSDRAAIGRLNMFPFHLEIVDELERKSYSEIPLPREGVVASSVESEVLSDGVRFTKRYPGAPFRVEERWRATEGELAWTVTVTPDEGIEPRSLAIGQFFPYPQKDENLCWWQVWLARAGYPRSTLEAAFSRVIYGDANIGMGIPMLSLYDATLDIGVSLAKPLGLRIPRWGFVFGDYRGGGVTAETSWIKLGDGVSPKTELLIRMHEGDWRPGLGWFAGKYPTYFLPGNPRAVEEIDGPFAGGRGGDTEEQAEQVLKYGAKAVEIHLHYACYGHYFPEEEEWTLRETWGKEHHEQKLSRDIVRRTIDTYKERGIHPLVYIQLSGDGVKAYAEKNFPESIARTVYGNRMGFDFFDTWMMNSDLSLSFGKHIAAQLERFFEMYPNASGLFWDQPCYDGIDAAHHDGITMVDNKPAYRLVFSYDVHRDRMVAEAHRRGMFVSANGPAYIELAEGLDQIMAEALSSADNVKYLCIERPMVVFGGASTATEAEFNYQTCLLTGATCPLAPSKPQSAEVEEVMFAYGPLLAPLRGRRWLLEANPLKLPSGTDGNIFRGRDGKVYVTLVSRLPRLAAPGEEGGAITFDVRFRGAEETKEAGYLTLKAEGWQEGEIEIVEGSARVTLGRHRIASTVAIG